MTIIRDPQALWAADIFVGHPTKAGPATGKEQAQALLNALTNAVEAPAIEVVEPENPLVADGVWLVRLNDYWLDVLETFGEIDLWRQDINAGLFIESGE